ncbi:hypothetical protein SUGI_0745020 [Cryptomeria japonica]|nr:hypothetical protein SUGI_0745020 [Cryptomeria japonica]
MTEINNYPYYKDKGPRQSTRSSGREWCSALDFTKPSPKYILGGKSQFYDRRAGAIDLACAATLGNEVAGNVKTL